MAEKTFSSSVQSVTASGPVGRYTAYKPPSTVGVIIHGEVNNQSLGRSERSVTPAATSGHGRDTARQNRRWRSTVAIIIHGVVEGQSLDRSVRSTHAAPVAASRSTHAAPVAAARSTGRYTACNPPSTIAGIIRGEVDGQRQ